MISADRLTELFDAHAAAMALYARQFGGDDADELVQEAFVRLLGQAAEPPAVKGWLLTTLRRLAIDRRRSALRRRRRECDQAAAWFTPSPGDGIDVVRATDLSRGLPERQREVVVLRLWNDQTLADIGRVLGVSTSTVHAELNAGLAALRLRMEPNDGRR